MFFTNATAQPNPDLPPQSQNVSVSIQDSQTCHSPTQTLTPPNPSPPPNPTPPKCNCTHASRMLCTCYECFSYIPYSMHQYALSQNIGTSLSLSLDRLILQVRLLTRFVRLPIPGSQQLLSGIETCDTGTLLQLV